VVAIGKGLLESSEILPSEDLPQVPSSAILYIIFTSGTKSTPVSEISSDVYLLTL